MKNILLSALIAFYSLSSCNQKQNHQEIEKLEIEAIKDYLSDKDKFLYDGASERLFKIIQDLDNDHDQDILLSGYYKGGWGNSGGEWTIYLNTLEGIKKCDEKISLYPSTARFDSNNSSILTYGRLGCCDGKLSRVSLNNCKLRIETIENFENDKEIAEKINAHFSDKLKFSTQSVAILGTENLNELNWEEWK